MSKAAQGFSPEAYLKYFEGGNLRRTPLIGKIAIYGWKLSKNSRKAGTIKIFSWAVCSNKMRGFHFYLEKITAFL